MTVILNRISYTDGEPCLPLIDTHAGITNPIPLIVNDPIPNIGVWFDARYCTCGSRLDSRDVDEAAQAEINIKTLCTKCGELDFVNVCSITGVKRSPTDLDSVRCAMCYKFMTECAEGYCVYVAILTDDPFEAKVGTTKLSRAETRIKEGGYAAMSVILPQEKSSFSLPEADYIEKRVIDEISFEHNSHIIRASQYFHRKIGYVGNVETKRNTLRALRLQPSEPLKNECESIAKKVVQHSNITRMVSLPSRLRLEVEQTYMNENEAIDRSALQRISENCLNNLDKHIINGRAYREMPAYSQIVAVKGDCVLLEDLNKRSFYSVVFSRGNYQGREIFNPAKVLPNRSNSNLRQWMSEIR